MIDTKVEVESYRFFNIGNYFEEITLKTIIIKQVCKFRRKSHQLFYIGHGYNGYARKYWQFRRTGS